MKILHYTLGFPPSRSGGLVTYVIDLIENQKRVGHEVFALFPGRYNPLKKSIQFKSKVINGIDSIELINSLPLPLFGGIKEPLKFMTFANESEYEQMLKSVSPDVIHVHTLMGIHKEFFEVAKKNNIKIVYTTHDYFGLAPEPNFYNNHESYDNNNTIANWIKASKHGMNVLKLRIFQSKYYPVIRKVAKKIRKTKKVVPDDNIDTVVDENCELDYLKLKNYYNQIFNLISKFHFNSTVARDVFLNNLDKDICFEVISISNNIINNNVFLKKKNDSGKIRLGYIGPRKEFKGFNDFVDLKYEIDLEKYELHTFGYDPLYSIPDIKQHGRYTESCLNNVYNQIDYLIVPSRWKETFGLIVPESLTYGTPVFVRNNVGAKDIVEEDFIFENIASIFLKLDSIKIKKVKLKTMGQHVEEIINFY